LLDSLGEEPTNDIIGDKSLAFNLMLSHFFYTKIIYSGGISTMYKDVNIRSRADREKNDYYATDPIALKKLLKYEKFDLNIWEPACGEGNLSEVLKEKGHNVYSTDLIDRGYQDEILDFLKTNNKWFGDIITNPPFTYTTEFVLKSLESIRTGSKVAMFYKMNYLSGVKRYKEIYSKFPPIRVYVFTKRVACSKNNNPEGFKGGAMDYIWCIWEKGQYAPTQLKWLE